MVSHDSFQSMYDILKFGEGTSALLAPTHFDDEGEYQQIIVWARKGDEFQMTRKLIQCGSQPVMYSPPAAKGKAPIVEEMCTLVLEIPKKVFGKDEDWKKKLLCQPVRRC